MWVLRERVGGGNTGIDSKEDSDKKTHHLAESNAEARRGLGLRVDSLSGVESLNLIRS